MIESPKEPPAEQREFFDFHLGEIKKTRPSQGYILFLVSLTCIKQKVFTLLKQPRYKNDQFAQANGWTSESNKA